MEDYPDKRLLIASLILPLSAALSYLDKSDEEIKSDPAFSIESYEEIRRAYDEYLTLSFYTDEEYPQRLKESANAPYCLIHHGPLEKLRHAVSVIGDWAREGRRDAPALQFAAELGANGIPLLTGIGGGVEYEARSGALLAGSPLFIASHYPLLDNRNLFRNYLYGGAYISTSHSLVQGKHYLLSTLPDAMVVFSPGKNDRVRINVKNALDNGKDVFLHKSALDCIEGEKLLSEGVKLIDGATHFLDLYGIESRAPALIREGKLRIVKCWR